MYISLTITVIHEFNTGKKNEITIRSSEFQITISCIIDLIFNI